MWIFTDRKAWHIVQYKIMADKIFNSPIRYPGSKTWLVKTLLDLIPSDTQIIVSPFCGGGVFELNAAIQGYRVFAYDIDKHLVNFYSEFIRDPHGFIERSKFLLMCHPDKAYWVELKKYLIENEWKGLTPEVYYIMNLLSYTGTWNKPYIANFHYIDGEFYKQRYKTQKPHEYSHRVCRYDKIWEVLPRVLLSFQVSSFDELSISPDAFVYCDPPYIEQGTYLYQHGEMNHELLADFLENHNNWALSYDDHQLIHDLYSDYLRIPIKRKSTFRVDGKNPMKTELLILSHSIAEHYHGRNR